jgi:hypothetical protein
MVADLTDAALVREMVEQILRAVPAPPRRRGRPLRADRLVAALIAAAIVARRTGDLPKFTRNSFGAPAGELMQLLGAATGCGDSGERHARRAVAIARRAA